MIGSFDRTIHAVQMSQDLHDLLLHHENIVFRVHSIFRGSVNLLSHAEELMTIARTDVDMMPMGIKVDLPAHIAWPFEVDDSVVYNGQLEFLSYRKMRFVSDCVMRVSGDRHFQHLQVKLHVRAKKRSA